MEMYNAAVEVAKKSKITPDQVDAWMDKLASFHVSISQSPRGFHAARISLPAEGLAQATTAAVAVIEAALGARAVACEVLTEDEFLAREGWESMPELVSVSEAAHMLGVSRQRVLQRIEARTLPATRVGRDWVISRAAVAAGAEESA